MALPRGSQQSCKPVMLAGCNHDPVSERNAVLRQWESYRLGSFVCFNTNQFTGEELCRIRAPKVTTPNNQRADSDRT